MTSEREKEAYAEMIGDHAFVLRPPSEAQRISNELTEGVSEALADGFQQLFGRQRWPSKN